eukprot:s6092_g1.t1
MRAGPRNLGCRRWNRKQAVCPKTSNRLILYFHCQGACGSSQCPCTPDFPPIGDSHVLAAAKGCLGGGWRRQSQLNRHIRHASGVSTIYVFTPWPFFLASPMQVKRNVCQLGGCIVHGWFAVIIRCASSPLHESLALANLSIEFPRVILFTVHSYFYSTPVAVAVEPSMVEEESKACCRWRRQRKQTVPDLSPILEEASALRCYTLESNGRRRNRTLESVLQLPPEQRAEALAELRAASLDLEMQAEGKCSNCMMQLEFCICKGMQAIRQNMLNHGTRSRLHFVVWIHHKERRRASNTGKILHLLLPESTDILIQGVARDEARLAELLERDAFVVYPSEDAKLVSEAVSLPSPAAAACSALEAEPPPVAILIDGTWNQAQRMHKRFQSLKHVKLLPSAKSNFHWRRQSQEGRISTIEAAALLLENLETPGQPTDGLPPALHKALSLLMDALGRQCHHDTLFAHELPEPTGKKKHALGAKKIQKELPGQRGSDAQKGEMGVVPAG